MIFVSSKDAALKMLMILSYYFRMKDKYRQLHIFTAMRWLGDGLGLLDQHDEAIDVLPQHITGLLLVDEGRYLLSRVRCRRVTG